MMSRPLLHPPLTHFPIAFWSLATFSDWVSTFSDLLPDNFSFILLALGTITAFGAIMTGFIEVGQIREKTPAMRAAFWHMGAMAAAFVLYLVSFLLRLSDAHAPVSVLALALTTAGFLCLVVGGGFGGQLVYTYGVGRKHRRSARSSQRPSGPSQ